jgi:restriction system protein
VCPALWASAHLLARRQVERASAATSGRWSLATYAYATQRRKTGSRSQARSGRRLQKQDGVWTVTPDGVEALETYAEPEGFWKQARALYAQWKKDTTVDVADEDDSEEELQEATSLEDAEDEARAEILGYLGKMPPFDFQTACAKLVGALGHRIAWISPPGPDGGLDFVAYADPIGATGRRIKGQAKRQQSKQDVDDVGAFLSKLKGDDAGVFIALGGFTKNAEVIARSDERRIVLIDGAVFVRLWIEH